jgi:acid phosphatase (class A)
MHNSARISNLTPVPNSSQRYRAGALLIALGTLLSGVAIAQTAGTSNRQGASYLLASQVDWISVLPAPPVADSPEQQRDLQAVLDMQASTRNNPARRQLAIDDAELGCFGYADVLGSAFDEKTLPKTTVFLRNATADGGAASNQVKTYWQRLRPYIVSDKVEKLADVDPVYEQQAKDKRRARQAKEEQETAAKDLVEGKSVKAKPPVDPEALRKEDLQTRKIKDNTSYPSGHSASGTMCAILLSEMLPEKQAALSARANVYRESRMIVGAHFRTDIDAGGALATAVAAVMSQNFSFQRDEAEARKELRAALGLPAAFPERKTNQREEQQESIARQ